MSPASESAESRWLAQLAAMRKAIAGLTIDQANRSVQEYGHDLLVEDDSLTSDSGNDDIWDVFSDEDYEYNSDLLERDHQPSSHGKYGQHWLSSKCVAYTNGKSGLDASEVQKEVSALLASDMPGVLRSIVSRAHTNQSTRR